MIQKGDLVGWLSIDVMLYLIGHKELSTRDSLSDLLLRGLEKGLLPNKRENQRKVKCYSIIIHGSVALSLDSEEGSGGVSFCPAAPK